MKTLKILLHRIKLTFLFKAIAKNHKLEKSIYATTTGIPIHIVKTFKNGYGFSIVGGSSGLHGNGVDTFELAVTYQGDLCYDTYITSDVMSYLTLDKAIETINKIKKL